MSKRLGDTTDLDREVYLALFDSFALSAAEVGWAVDLTSQAANSVLARLEKAGLVARSRVKGQKALTWQTTQTYDEITRGQAEARFTETYTDDNEEPDMTTTAATSPGAATPAPTPTCRCGCGRTVKGTFAPGHDAKHASEVARQVVATGNVGLIRELPTEALQGKATRIAQRIADQATQAQERAEAKAKAAQQRAEAKAQKQAPQEAKSAEREATKQAKAADKQAQAAK